MLLYFGSFEKEMEFSPIFAQGSAPSKRAYHTCSHLGGALYVFGGITADKTVLNDMYRYDITSNSWIQIERKGPKNLQSKTLVTAGFLRGSLCPAPSASHHTATVIEDRYILVIGGWNGRRRSAEVFCFDTADQGWRHIPASGDVPVGLSSHTATLVSSSDILIIGREGGVRTQRRFSGAFYLNFETGRYTEAPFHAASRSGHTANLIPIRGSRENHLFVLGGRKSGGYELIGFRRKAEQPQCSFPKSRIDNVLEKCTCCYEPSGRQHAQAIELDRKHLFVFGGETWSGARENVTNDAFVLATDKMKWYKVPLSRQVPKLVGHSMAGFGEKIFVFGGGDGNKCSDNLWEIKL